MTRRLRKRESKLRQPLSDLDDLRMSIPTLEEDFHHPCPGCGQELVIRADQPFPRVKCGQCNENYTLDRRIGGQLCLLRYNAREYAGQRAFLLRLKTIKFRLVTLGLGLVLVGSLIAALTVNIAFGLIALAALIGGIAGDFNDLQDGPNNRQQRRRRPRNRRDPSTGSSSTRSGPGPGNP